MMIMPEEAVTTADMTKAVTSDKNAPSVVILGACHTADGTMTRELADAGVGVVFGFTGGVNRLELGKATAVLTLELAKGETINDAADSARAYLNRLPRLVDHGEVSLEFEVSEGIDPDKNLEDNGLLSSPDARLANDEVSAGGVAERALDVYGSPDNASPSPSPQKSSEPSP
jgi:hypothetical protein